MLRRALIAAALLLSGCAAASGEERLVDIPSGTFERVMRGEFVDLLPSRVEARVGDVLVIDNQDVVTHVVGPFRVRPGERLRHVWTKPGVYEGDCTLSASDHVRIVVTDDERDAETSG